MVHDAVNGPTFTVGANTYTAPAGTTGSAPLRSAVFAPSDSAGDVNRDGDTTDRWGVLYDPATHDIRVDTNANLDFTDDLAMQPYGSSFQIGHFGTDNPATDVAEQVPFTVELEGQRAGPTGGPTTSSASTSPRPSTAPTSPASPPPRPLRRGDERRGSGRQAGRRPRLLSDSCSNAALTDGLVELVTNRHVDVVNISIGGLPALNDGNNARVELYNRLIHDYGVQIVLSAGNSGPGINTIGDPGLADRPSRSAASVTKETWPSNYNSVSRPTTSCSTSPRAARARTAGAIR